MPKSKYRLIKDKAILILIQTIQFVMIERNRNYLKCLFA